MLNVDWVFKLLHAGSNVWHFYLGWELPGIAVAQPLSVSRVFKPPYNPRHRHTFTIRKPTWKLSGSLALLWRKDDKKTFP